MNEAVACRADNLTKATAGQAWQKLLLGAGGTYEVPRDTAAAVTSMGSMVYFATVKPLYGHQEGAELGYNPRKPGRPSHNYHTYFIGSLRLILSVEVHGGKQHAGRHSMPGLWALLDGLPAVCRPRLIRGECLR